jgi:hypothetical protein
MITQIIKNTVRTLPLFLLLSTSIAQAETFTHYIVEPFSCEVALADYAELQRRLEVTPRMNWKYEIFLDEYKAVVEALDEHSECEVK